MALRGYLATLLTVISTIVVISGVTPMFTLCLVPIMIYYMAQQNFFTVSEPLITALCFIRYNRVAPYLIDSLYFFAENISRTKTLGFSKQKSHLRLAWRVSRWCGNNSGLPGRGVAHPPTQRYAQYTTGESTMCVSISISVFGASLTQYFACLADSRARTSLRALRSAGSQFG
jgi:hypothetical protein